jgi:polyphosphate kinase
VEAVAPVEDPDVRSQLRFVLELAMNDNRKRWEMDAEGHYEQVHPGDGEPVLNMQSILMDQTREATRRRDVERGCLAVHPEIESDLLVTPHDPDATVDGRTSDDVDTGVEEAGGGDSEATSDGTASGAGMPMNGEADEVPTSAEPTTSASTDAVADGETTADAEEDLPELMRTHRDHWYVPRSRHYEYAVRTPSGGREYRKTTTAVVDLLEKYYE